MTSVLVKVVVVAALILRRSFPAIRGAASIAHMLKCVRPSVSDRPLLPTSSMSGSFQWPGPAKEDRFASISTRPIIEDQLALMSKPILHMLAIMGRLIEQVFGGQPLPSPGLML